MSEQPPYAPGPQQPGPPYGNQPNPYGNQPHPGGYPAYPGPQAPYGANQPKSNTTRNVLLIVGLVVLLFCGGIVTAVVVLINNAEEAVSTAFDDEYAGNRDDPLTVTEGEAFSIRGFDYEAGWTVTPNDDFSDAISGLRGTNDRSDATSESISLTFTFLQGNEVVQDLRCSSPGSVGRGRSTTLECLGEAPGPASYDTIEVYDNALFE